MKSLKEFITSPTGHLALVATLLLLGMFVVRWARQRHATTPLPAAKSAAAISMPKIFTREGARFPQQKSAATLGTLAAGTAEAARAAPVPAEKPKPRALPLTLFAAQPLAAPTARALAAPYGRLIPCETVVALESNRLETPIIGLVTEDVCHDGRLVVPAGAEVHGRAALDRTRERLAAQGPWRIVWRTPDADNGNELAVDGLVLDREFDGATGAWGEHDGSAGLRGELVKTDDDRELKLFAATFLASATAALQENRTSAGLLGETSLPAATVRNATLAGTGAVLREFAQSMRDTIARDGFYLRVPAGKPFYLYVTQKIDRSQARESFASAAPSKP